MKATPFAVSHTGALALTDKGIRWRAALATHGTLLPLPRGVSADDVAALGISGPIVSLVTHAGDVYRCSDAGRGEWRSEGGVFVEPAPPPPPREKRTLAQPPPRDGIAPPLVRCEALKSFAVGGGTDCERGDEVSLDFVRAQRLESSGLVRVLDRAAFNRERSRHENAAESWRA